VQVEGENSHLSALRESMDKRLRETLEQHKKDVEALVGEKMALLAERSQREAEAMEQASQRDVRACACQLWLLHTQLSS
jgi:hypothetical protein